MLTFCRKFQKPHNEENTIGTITKFAPSVQEQHSSAVIPMPHFDQNRLEQALRISELYYFFKRRTSLSLKRYNTKPTVTFNPCSINSKSQNQHSRHFTFSSHFLSFYFLLDFIFQFNQLFSYHSSFFSGSSTLVVLSINRFDIL